MSGDRYKIADQNGVYFLTFTVVDWIDIFTRPAYKDIIVESLNYCVDAKGLQCYAWVLMTNHMHLVASVASPQRMSDFVRDFKKFTSKRLVAEIQQLPESRREWMLHKFEYWARSTGRAENFKVWQDSSHAVILEGGGNRLQQKIEYVHQNPVRQKIVLRAEDYTYSSACDYHGIKGLVQLAI